MSVTEDALTPFGGLVPWAAYTKHIGIAEALAADCPVKRTSPNAAPVYDIIQSFMLTALTDGRRFSHVERLREDPTIPDKPKGSGLNFLNFEVCVEEKEGMKSGNGEKTEAAIRGSGLPCDQPGELPAGRVRDGGQGKGV